MERSANGDDGVNTHEHDDGPRTNNRTRGNRNDVDDDADAESDGDDDDDDCDCDENDGHGDDDVDDDVGDDRLHRRPTGLICCPTALPDCFSSVSIHPSPMKFEFANPLGQ